MRKKIGKTCQIAIRRNDLIPKGYSYRNSNSCNTLHEISKNGLRCENHKLQIHFLAYNGQLGISNGREGLYHV